MHSSTRTRRPRCSRSARMTATGSARIRCVAPWTNCTPVEISAIAWSITRTPCWRNCGKTHPSAKVGILAYVDHTAPPMVARPHPRFVTLLTHMPWEFCQAHPIEDAACAVNARFLRYLEGWRARAVHVGVYDYYGHFYAFTPWPIVHSIRKRPSAAPSTGSRPVHERDTAALGDPGPELLRGCQARVGSRPRRRRPPRGVLLALLRFR